VAAEATPVTTGGRSLTERSLRARLPDQAMRWILTALAAGILVLIGFFFVRLIVEAEPALSKFGVLGFAFDNDWDVSRSIYGALPLVVGTLVTSAIALLIGVPVAVATAVFLTEMCPRRARPLLTILVELLAAVPSVVYGLWGVFVLIPRLKGPEEWFGRTFDFLPFVGPDVAGPNYFVAGLILAIMILPIVSAISREVIATVPEAHKEAALALGATRWEMIRMAVLPYGRSGIIGGAMLGLGRALGETMAIALVLSVSGGITFNLISSSNPSTIAANIALQFPESSGLDVNTLIFSGLALFVITFAVNVLARSIVNRRADFSGANS
jgi:phosphate transport system permease protein